MRSAVVFAVLAAVVSAMPLVEKRTGGEAYATPPGTYIYVVASEVPGLTLRCADIEKRTGGEAYATPPGMHGGQLYDSGLTLLSRRY